MDRTLKPAGFALVLVACSPDVAPPTPEPMPPAAAAPRFTDEDVRQALAAMGREVLPAQRLAERVNPLWDHLHDEERSVDKMIADAKRIAELATSARKAMPQRYATTACAKEIENATRTYLDANVTWSAALVTWLQENRAKLVPLLARGTFPDTCDDATVACGTMPDQSSAKYAPGEGASFGRVASIKCTHDLFVCEPGPAKACEVWELKQQLGLEHGHPARRVRSRVNGQTVETSPVEPAWAN